MLRTLILAAAVLVLAAVNFRPYAMTVLDPIKDGNWPTFYRLNVYTGEVCMYLTLTKNATGDENPFQCWRAHFFEARSARAAAARQEAP